ncbi:MAG: phenylalanine--tRNA ligase subunit beta [Desulfobacterota bacterium]|jgi:phenylalanyl-tRNA synthetase beta chain|nr:phenylalanine--tRNA ligase subunit beta [Thermodesulfobacteriota bacterium]
MRVSLNWLKEYVTIPLSVDDLADLLTMAGLEVEAREPLGRSLEEVVAARVLSVRPHPGADALWLCDVDAGHGSVQVVCGAPNVRAGMMTPMAPPGTKLPGGMEIKESRIRGEASVGMLLAEDEMGLTDDHTGVMVLPESLAPGAPVAQALSLEDWALEIGLTPNRPDCACVIGIAREIAALTKGKLRKPEIRDKESGRRIETLTSVTLDDPEGCPRYAAGMICGFELKPSPFWMRYRLHVSGIRGISNVVDVTNYILLEMGQPLHAFDYDRLKENRIVVRKARDGEVFTTLDGKTHTLNRDNLMICDGQRPVALAGVMGGLNSEIFSESKNVLIESANFDAITVRRSSKRLGLSTEASYRFERGVDIGGVVPALRRAMMLISELGGGEVIQGIIDNYPAPRQPVEIDLRVDKTNRFLGTDLSQDTIKAYLQALEMEVEPRDANVLRVAAPLFRVDLTRDWDLMEEVARMEGYDRIPVTMPAIRPSDEKESPEMSLGDRVRDILVGLGFSEVISFSFVAPESADSLGAEKDSPLRSFVPLLNPLTVDQSVMRTSLVPGLLAAVKTNLSYGEKDLRLFEWGRVFIRREGKDLPEERLALTGLITGLANPKEWHREERASDFYDAKGAAEALLKALGLRSPAFERGNTPPWYSKETASLIRLAGQGLGIVGQLSAEALKRFDVDAPEVFAFEIDGSVLLRQATGQRTFEPLAKFPAVYRDLSIVAKRSVESAKIQEIILRVGGGLVESVSLFDLFKGGKIDPSEKALAFRICYRSRESTLDGKDINKLHESIVQSIGKETGARLREV